MRSLHPYLGMVVIVNDTTVPHAGHWRCARMDQCRMKYVVKRVGSKNATSSDLQISIEACISSMQLPSYKGISWQGIESLECKYIHSYVHVFRSPLRSCIAPPVSCVLHPSSWLPMDCLKVLMTTDVRWKRRTLYVCITTESGSRPLV